MYRYVDERNPEFLQSKRYQPPNPYGTIVKIELFVLSIVVLLFASTFYPMFSNAKTNELAAITTEPSISPTNEQVLGTNTEKVPSTTPALTATPTPIPSPTLTPTPTGKPHKKNSYTIAIYGDSMIDTMGERLEYLEHSLKASYPDVNFTLYNYGIGAQNVEMGLERWNNRLDYQDRHYPAITEVKPDIVIVGSFAYNPFSPYDRNRHWIGLTKLVQQAQTVSPHVYMLAEIAPLRSNFGKGPNGVNWDENTAYTHSGWIVEQLENVVGLSKTLQVPLIDVFDPSKGHPEYTNPSDGIHPSVAGHEFTADIITNTIKLN